MPVPYIRSTTLHTRSKGAGTITYRKNRWLARAPTVRGKCGICLGGYSYRKQAEQALATWLAEQPKEAT